MLLFLFWILEYKVWAHGFFADRFRFQSVSNYLCACSDAGMGEKLKALNPVLLLYEELFFRSAVLDI